MNKIEVDALTSQHNYAVVRLPDRRFPGVVFQGDSLSILVDQACTLLRTLEAEDLATAHDEAADLAATLTQIQQIYEGALAQHSIPLPYTKP